ncbi:hypothetical protein SLS57_002400 [Botryosphaeria dothidea]
MEGLRSPNPGRNGRNPALKDGQGKYDKDFLLSFRDVFTSPPVQLGSNLRKAGTETERHTIIQFLQKRNRERLAAKEEQLNQQQKDLYCQYEELQREKLDFYQERMVFYSNYTSLQARVDARFQELSKELNELESAKLRNTAHVSKKLAEIEDQKETYVELQVKAKMSEEQLTKKTDRMIAVSKKLLDFLRAQDVTSEEHRLIVTTFETELRAMMGDGQHKTHENRSNSPENPGSHDDNTAVLGSDLKIPYGGKDALVLIGGIPNGLGKEEITRAVDVVSGNTIRVHGIFPGSPSATAVGYCVAYPDKFFEGKFCIVKDLNVESIGKACLHFRVIDI